MFSFIIISNIDLIPVNVYQALSVIGVPKKEIGERLFVECEGGMQDGWIAFQPIENAQYDYEIDELEEIREKIPNPSFYLVEGRNGVINFSNRFIQEFCPLGKVLIDNDHGMITDLDDVKGKIKSGEDWLYLPS